MYNYKMTKDYYNYTNNNYINPYQGFIRGNLFPNLYNYYKNPKPYNITPANDQAEMLTNIGAYSFALDDLNLYLDLHPDDQNMIALYNQYVNQYQAYKNEYSRKYGNLDTTSINADKNEWTWVEEPWPWQGVK